MDHIYITQAVIEHFKCVLCDKHVFVSPITTKDDRSFKCGRCVCIKSDHPIQVHALEKLASYFKFPCCFEGCDETIPWGNVIEHERLCNYRVINCPSGHCKDRYSINKIVTHFDQKHKNYISSANQYRLNNSFGAHLRMFFYNQEPYLMIFYENKVRIYIGVYSVNAKGDNVPFQVQFNASSTNKSLIFRSNVVLFNDQEHCLNCLHHICNNNYHKYSSVDRNCDIKKNMPFVIDKTYLTMTLDSEIVCYIVKIMGEMKDRDQTFVKNLECPVCQCLMSGSIFSCRVGHAICEDCSDRLKACPLCAEPLTNMRCFALEGIAESLRLLCINKEKGCEFVGNVDQCKNHEKTCAAAKR
ncbi:hypothetical protein GWI33_004730 [Rhynchophorus ferrugineus]|uniref:RING-type E3 ubiquitin transferase n=2 Tax=Rhynchophorus ferrugineus TaxID=354439 RepID=A0A834IIK1_RHYFE|nr:hypothetical protein GWI33_004730 [Rhynchophorus ferrugineus]